MKTWGVAVLVLAVSVAAEARKESKALVSPTEAYLARVRVVQSAAIYSSPGSLWVDNGAMSGLAADYKARHVGDVLVVQIVEDVTATSSSTLNTQRKFQGNSGIAGVAGKIDTSSISTLLSLNAATQLQGQGQAATKTSIRTSVGGKVIAVLPSGNLVIEARRDATANNEKQTVLLRGVARPGDVTPDNTVLSTQLSDLEVELKGHGVLSEASRPPNWVVRMIFKVLGF
jgi:flagellar L-ring protein precursor FlgH